MKKIYAVKKFSSRKLHTAFLLACGIFTMTFHPVFAEAEVSVTNAESVEDDAVEEISEQMLVISKDTWNNREINLLGRGSRNLLFYGNTRAGALNNVTLSGSKTPIYILMTLTTDCIFMTCRTAI